MCLNKNNPLHTSQVHSSCFTLSVYAHAHTGLNRSGKSCRMRWVNYLHPSRKHGRLSQQEERLVIELHSRWGNRFVSIVPIINNFQDFSFVPQSRKFN